MDATTTSCMRRMAERSRCLSNVLGTRYGLATGRIAFLHPAPTANMYRNEMKFHIPHSTYLEQFYVKGGNLACTLRTVHARSSITKWLSQCTHENNHEAQFQARLADDWHPFIPIELCIYHWTSKGFLTNSGEKIAHPQRSIIQRSSSVCH